MIAFGKRLNKSRITARLFKLVINRSEKEQQAILKVLEKRPVKGKRTFSRTGLGRGLNESSVTARLLKSITERSEEEQRTILKVLKKRQVEGKRRHIRKPYFMVVNHNSLDRNCTDFIQDISAGGMFIATPLTFSVGQEVSMTFPLPNYQEHLEINGEVVRTCPKGIGVEFRMADQDQRTKIKSLLDMV